jgi:hypothetical protein
LFSLPSFILSCIGTAICAAAEPHRGSKSAASPAAPHPITELEGGVVAEEICSGRGSPAVGPGELGDARQVAVLRARTTLFSGVSVVLYLAVVVKTHL